jgi:muconolactone delta-isomerase
VQGPQNHPQGKLLARKTHRAQNIVVLMAAIYYSKKYRARSTKGKGAWHEIWRKLGTNFQKSFLSGVIQDVFDCSSNELWQLMKCLPGKPFQDSVPASGSHL